MFPDRSGEGFAERAVRWMKLNQFETAARESEKRSAVFLCALLPHTRLLPGSVLVQLYKLSKKLLHGVIGLGAASISHPRLA